MSPEKLDMKYSTNKPLTANTHGFFTMIEMIRLDITAIKNNGLIDNFAQPDEVEIARGTSYAFFPELLNLVEKNQAVTTDAFRQCLIVRKITDVDFQNKILAMTLQTKVGLQFGIGKILFDLAYYHSQDLGLSYPQIKLEVQSNQNIDFIFESNIEDRTKDPREPVIQTLVRINITPDSVFITDFNLTKLSDNKEGSRFFDALKANQQNILMQLITWIRHRLGYHAELILEQQAEDCNRFPWRTCHSK